MELGPPELSSPGVDDGLLVAGGTSIITVAGPELAVGEIVVVEGSPLPSSPVTVRVTKEAGVEDEPGPAAELEGGTSTITVPEPVDPDGEIVDVMGSSVGLRVLPVVVIVTNGMEEADGATELGTTTITVPGSVGLLGGKVLVLGSSVGERSPGGVTVT